jgi:hypothetical protein
VNEFHDPELERMLGRASCAYPDANVAFETVRGRVRQVRRRRALVASTATCVLLVGIVAVAVRGGSDDSKVAPSHLSVDSSVSVAPTTPTTDMSTPTTEMASETTAAPTAVTTMGTDSGGPGPNSSKGSKDTKPSTTTTTTTTAPVPQVQPTVPHVDVQWFLSKGGSAGIQLVSGRMLLVGTSSAAGFTAHVTEASGDRIRVEFSNGMSTYEMQLELSDGVVVRSVQHKGA